MNKTKINKIVIKRKLDIHTDLSHLGTFSNEKGKYAIEHNLDDMFKWMGTDQEMDLLLAFRKWPPHYRSIGSCSQEDITNCKKYVDLLVNVVNTLEEK